MPIHTTIAFFAVPSTCGGGKLTFHSARGRMQVYDCFMRAQGLPRLLCFTACWPPGPPQRAACCIGRGWQHIGCRTLVQ